MPLGRRRRVRRRRAAMIAGGAYAVHRHNQNQQEEAYEQEPAGDDAPAEAPEAGGNSVAQLTELKGLLDSGALTQDEFDAEKQKIIGV